jgi:hypothetical protein
VEIHVMGTITVRDRRRKHCLRWDTRYGAFTDAGAKDDIRIDGEMGTMVFIRCNRKYCDTLLFGSLSGFVPDHFSEAIFHRSLLNFGTMPWRQPHQVQISTFGGLA